jgi:hypothetical protein
MARTLQSGKSSGTSRLLKDDIAHGLTVSPPNRDKLTMRLNSLKTLNIILSSPKD